MESKDSQEDQNYEPRPNDYLVEPMFAPLAQKQSQDDSPEQVEASPKGPLGKLWSWLRRP